MACPKVKAMGRYPTLTSRSSYLFAVKLGSPALALGPEGMNLGGADDAIEGPEVPSCCPHFRAYVF